jgi:ssDNA-binding replication factor A large subunit
MTNVQSHAEDIHEQFSDSLDVTVEDVEDRLDTLINEYRVPVDEARRSVVNTYLDQAGMERDELGGGSNEDVQAADVDEPDQWVEMTAEVVELWDARSDAVGQVGLLGDESGTIKFTKWADSDLPELEEGTAYRLGNLVTDEYEGRFSVTLNRTTTVEDVSDEVDLDVLNDRSSEVTVEEIAEDEQWIDLTAKVVDLWDAPHESIAQTGLLGDPTGKIKFTKWDRAELPELEEGAVYRFRNAVTDEFEDRFSVTFNRTTSVEELDEDLEVGDEATEATGVLVDIQSGSGLIKRCPEEDCTRVLQNGRCSEHGEVEGEFDLRIKGVLDDGEQVHEVIFDQDATADLTGISLEEAKEMAMDALDTEVVADEMRGKVLGRYYRVSGPTLGRYLLVNEMDELGAPDHEAALIKARSI